MIKLIKAFPYDNRYDYVKMFATKQEQNNYFNSLPNIRVDETNYIKMHKTINVKYSFDYLESEGINYIIFNNGYKDIYAFIVNKRYVREELTELIYEVDVIQTYMFDFSIGKSFIERKVCNINEITDYDEGIEIGEHYIKNEWNVLLKDGTYFAMFNGFKDYDISSGEIKEVPLYDTNRPATYIDGVLYPIMLIALDDEVTIQKFYKYMIDLPSLIGIIYFPSCEYEVTSLNIPLVLMQDGVLAKVNLPINKVVTVVNGEGDSYTLSNPIDKEDICDFYPYTFYVLTDGEAPPLCLQPQFMPDIVTVESVVALSHTPLERYYVKGYKGDTNGRIYNVTNSSCLMLPTGKNAGMETIIANANQIQQQRTSMINNVLMTGVNIMGMGMINQMNASSMNSSGSDLSSYANQIGSVNSLNTLVSTVNGVKENMARLKDIELTPSSIASYGTPSSRNQFGNFTVRLIKYTIQEKYKERIRNFINRYGNKYNNYATINLKNYKGFIKFNSPDIDSKIDNIYINKIREILERGVYIE